VGGYTAVILAGGAARRLGGVPKPLLPVGGRPMLDRVLAAVSDATVTVVVGPAGLAVPPGVLRASEEPPGGGPVAALAAGVAAIDRETDRGTGRTGEVTAVLAADLPFLTPKALADLRTILDNSTVDGAVFVDDEGRRQTLCGVWRTATLRRRLAEVPEHHGAALRHFLADLDVREVTSGERPPPWYDCDSQDDLDRARRWS
jgi:molybdopterin-guanine dinucleotide biosynthesis protein A